MTLVEKAEEYIASKTKEWTDGAYDFTLEEVRTMLIEFAKELKEQVERMEHILKNQGCRFCEYYKGKSFEEPCRSCTPYYDKWELMKE